MGRWGKNSLGNPSHTHSLLKCFVAASYCMVSYRVPLLLWDYWEWFGIPIPQSAVGSGRTARTALLRTRSTKGIPICCELTHLSAWFSSQPLIIVVYVPLTCAFVCRRAGDFTIEEACGSVGKIAKKRLQISHWVSIKRVPYKSATNSDIAVSNLGERKYILFD